MTSAPALRGLGAVATLLAWAHAVAAQEVTLRDRGGAFAVSGVLAGYDGAIYRLDTPDGPLTLDASAVLCEGEGCPDDPAIVVEGAADLVDVLMPALVEAFAARRGLDLSREAGDLRLIDGDEALTIHLRRRGGEGAAPIAGDGRVDVALVRGAPIRAEVRAARAAGAGDIAAPGRTSVLAHDALVPVVSPRNPVGAVTAAQLVALFAGEIGDWAALGGPAGPVSLHVVEGETARAFAERVLGPAGRSLAETAILHPDADALARAVARDPGAVGVAGPRRTRLVEPLALAGPCGLVSRPGPNAVRAGDWPLSLPVTARLPARPLPRLAADLAVFATSAEAQAVVRRAGLLDRTPHEIPVAAQGDRLAAAILAAEPGGRLDALQGAVAELGGLTRLTPTFRFTGGTRLDAASREAVGRLAARIASGAHDGRRLVFVGFGDATGTPGRNEVLSRRRADAVLEAVRAAVPPRAGGPVLSASGHGAALPVACDDTAEGRRLNRRVELWTH